MEAFKLLARIIVQKQEAEKDLDAFENKMKGLDEKIKKSAGEMASYSLTKVGKGLQTVGSGLTKYITKPALVAGTAMAGITLKKGWDRMTSIDNAKVKLGALGNSAKDVKNIMNNALASVKDTTYGLDEAATTAAGAVASGVKAGKPLERYLTNVADLAAVAGTGMGEMGYILNKVQASGRASNQELGMLTERGLPVYEWLAKESGKTADEIFNMASKGQISSEMLQNAIEKNIGGAAKKIGSKTIRGAIANFGASLSRVGANFIGSADDADSFAGKVLPILNNAMKKMGGVEDAAKRWGKVAGEVFGAIVQYFKNGKVDTDKLSESGKNLFSKLKPVLSIIKLITKAFGKMSGKGKLHFAVTAVAAGPLLKATGKVMGKMSKTYEWYKKNEKQIHALGGATKKYGGKLMGLVKPAKLAAGAQKLLAGALVPLPVLIIIGVIAALIGMFVLLWKKSDAFRQFWKDAWKDIKDAAMEVWEALKPIVETVMDAIQDIIDIILGTIKDIWHEYGSDIKEFCTEVFKIIETVIMTVMESIKEVVSAVWDAIKTFWHMYGDEIKAYTKLVWDTIKNVVEAAMEIIKAVIKIVMSLIKGDWEGVWEGIKQVVSGIWAAIKATISYYIGLVLITISAVWSTIKELTGAIWEAIKNTITSIWDTIKSVVTSAINGVKNTVTNIWNSIRSTTTSIWNGIKSAITTPISSAISFVQSGINKIKGLFNFRVRWPHIPVPRFHVSGSLNPLQWLKGNKPHISITWHAEGGIMEKPTIFGMNGINLMGGGEAGPEAIAPISKLRTYLKDTVDNKGVESRLDSLIALLENLLPEVIDNMDKNIVLDSGELIGKIDKDLGALNTLKERGI